MSRSEFKAKSTRQKSRSAKPYERSNSNLVDKVKSWLTPSSWLSYLSPSKDDGSSRQLQKDDTSLPPPTHTHPLTDDHPLSSNTAAEDGPGPSDKPTSLQRSDPLPPVSNLFNRDKSNRNSTANFRAALSLFEDALTENHQESNNLSISNNSSNESFVEEDTEPEVIDTSQDTSDTSMQTGGLSTEGALSSSEDRLSSITRTHSPAPQVGGNETQEHDVQSVSNPTFSNKIKPSYRQTVKMSSRVTTGLSAELTRRLYSSMAVTTSTPELSPVREKQEEDMNGERATSPFQPVLPGLQSTTFSVSGLATPARLFTNESISRSPFRSPFYSGRTSFGGAASHQKLRVKRPRTESSPPVFAPLRVSVQATPTTGNAGQSVVSATAKRIMDTLNSLTSPLSDARKIPMRGLPPEMQQAKRRRVSECASSLLSPPPVAPLQSTRPHPLTQLVPSLKKSMGNTSTDHTDSTPTHSHHTSTTHSKFAPQVLNSHSLISSSSPTSSVLAGLKFSAPPPLQSPPTHDLKSGRSPKMKSFHAGGGGGGGGGGGKMSRRSRGARTRRTSDGDDSEEEYHNPVAPPPRVGLSLGQGGALPAFGFHSQLLPNKAIVDKSSAPPKLLMASKPMDQQPPSFTPNFSFSKPTPISPGSPLSTNTPSKVSFGFSAPKPHLSTGTPGTTALVSFSSSLATTKTPLTLAQKAPSKTPPPLKTNMSVVEALRKPEYSQFLSSNKNMASETSGSKSQDVVDLTASDDESAEKEKPKSQPLSRFAPPIGSWECEQCLISNKASVSKCVACAASKPGGEAKTSGLQIGSTPGFKLAGSGFKLPLTTSNPFPLLRAAGGSWECSGCLLSNKLSDDKCVACKASNPNAKSKASNEKAKPFPGLTISSSTCGWTCDTCLVSNKQQDVKCVACSSSKPGAQLDSKATTSGSGLSLSNTGGFKLGTGVSLGGSLKSGASTSGETSNISGGFKLGSGAILGSGGFGSNSGVSLGSMSGGIKLGAGLSLLGGSQLASPAKQSWSCDTCLLVNKAEADSCIACSASKPRSSQPKSNITGGLKLGGSGLNLSSRKPQDSSGSSKWTCDTCLIQNKDSDSACVACTTAKPGSQKETKKDEHKSGGFQFGPTGGFKMGGGFTLGSVSTATSSNTSSHDTCLLPAATISSKTTGNESTTQPTLLLGTPSTTTPETGFKLPSNISLGNKPSTDSPLSGLTFGALNPSAGIKLGGGGLQTSISLSLGGPVLSTASTSLTQFAANNSLGGSNASTGNSPLAGIKLGSLTSAAPVTLATTTTSLSTGITLGGTFSSTANSPLLSGIKLGGSFNTGTGLLTGGSPLKLGQPSNPLTGIKLGGMLTTTTTTAAASNSPLAGIKLGGGGGLVAPPTTVPGLQTQSQGLPKLSTNFALGNTSTNSVGMLNFTGSSPQAPAFQFSGAKASASSMFGTNTPTSKSNTGLSFASSFGGQQALSMATPARDSSQAEMQSPDEMTMEPDQAQGTNLIFGSAKPSQQQQTVGANIFSGQLNPSQNTSGFSFTASKTAANTFGTNLPKPSFNFGNSGSTSLTFTGSAPQLPTQPSSSGLMFPVSAPQLPSSSGLMFSGSAPQPPTQPSSSGLMFSATQQTTAAPLQTSTGYNFSNNPGISINFGQAAPQAPTNMFAANPNPSTPGRVIKKARRRKV